MALSIFGLVGYGCSDRTENMGLQTMAISTCAKCEGHAFERGLVTPLGEQRAISVLQCAGCGTVFGTLEGQLGLERLQTQVAGIDAGLVRIAKALSEM
jgi:hypothetical protein